MDFSIMRGCDKFCTFFVLFLLQEEEKGVEVLMILKKKPKMQ